MVNFDPNGAASEDSGIFGLPFTPKESDLVLIPVPWEATASYGSGCSFAPSAIFDASMYVELYDLDLKNFYEKGIAITEELADFQKLNKKALGAAQTLIKKAGNTESKKVSRCQEKANNLCAIANKMIQTETSTWLNRGKLVGLIGGDHSISLGSIKAHMEKYPDMGVLQIDAHCDLRKAFEGLTYSHASVMYNVMEETSMHKLVQVGVRGFCDEEFHRIQESNGRVVTFFDNDLQDNQFKGKQWADICDEIVSQLPEHLYISFDIDGFDPKLCPGTGTPVPGGLNYNQAIFLIKKIAAAGKKIIGFDLVEVAPIKKNNWDANLAAHLLYQLAGWTITSNN